MRYIGKVVLTTLIVVVVLGLLIVGCSAALSANSPKIKVRPAPAPADTYPNRAGTLAFKVLWPYKRSGRLTRVVQVGKAPCGFRLIRHKLNVRLRARRWTVVRFRRSVVLPVNSPNACQGRSVKLRIRVTATRH
jgi:hypothetical protein